MKKDKILRISNAPFIFSKRTTASLVWGTIAALAPALIWGIYCFGIPSAVLAASSIGGALAAEAIMNGLRRRFTLLDGSAFLTGLLVGMAMPPGISPYIPAVSSFFSVAVVKCAFGGLGSNWMNPALAGIVFSLVNWPSAMNTWMLPHHLTEVVGVSGIVATSGATPLGVARSHASLMAAGSGPMDALAAAGAKFSGFDMTVTETLNRSIFSRLGADLPGGYIDLLVGNKCGAIGELSAILILAASILLLSRKMIRWEIPASVIGSFTLLTLIFGGLTSGNGFFSGDVLFALLSGSFLLVAFFMASDPVTSPSSRTGMLIYGIGVGILAFVFRSFGASAEGSAFAVILMNCAVPAIAKLDTGLSLRRAVRAGVEPLGGGR